MARRDKSMPVMFLARPEPFPALKPPIKKKKAKASEYWTPEHIKD